MLGFQQEQLLGALIGLARATVGNEYLLTDSTAAVIVEGLCVTMLHVKCNQDTLLDLINRADAEKRKLVPMCYECTASCGRTNNYDMQNLWTAEEEIRSVKSRILFGIQDIAGCTAVPCPRDTADFLYKALFAIGMDDWGMDELLPILQEMSEVKQKCVAVTD